MPLSTPTLPAEPEFDEVWFPGGRRPENTRHQNRRPHQADPASGDAAAEGKRPPRRFNRDAAPAAANGDKPARPDGDKAPGRPRFDPKRSQPGGNGHAGGKPKFSGKREREQSDWKEHRPREKRDVAVDPDSPWAALAALRNPKSE